MHSKHKGRVGISGTHSPTAKMREEGKKSENIRTVMLEQGQKILR